MIVQPLIISLEFLSTMLASASSLPDSARFVLLLSSTKDHWFRNPFSTTHTNKNTFHNKTTSIIPTFLQQNRFYETFRDYVKRMGNRIAR